MVCLSLFVANLKFSQPATITIEQSEQQSEQDEPVSFYSVSDAVQSVVHINLDTQQFFLGLTSQEDESDEISVKDQFILSQSKKVKILLQQIISPNAP